jgi:hypothetical protein
MSAPKGYPNQEKNFDYTSEFSTVEPIRDKQHGLSVLAHQFMKSIGSDAAESGSSTKIVKATGHSARRGDVISFTSGALIDFEFKVWKGKEDSDYQNQILIAEEMPGTPSAGNTFDILRHKYPKVSDLGAASVVLTPPDIVDFLDDVVLDSSTDSIPASGDTPLTVVTSLAASASKIRVADTTGKWLGLYADPSGTPSLIAVINPGADGEIEVAIPAGTEIGVRNIFTGAISVGELCVQFLG